MIRPGSDKNRWAGTSTPVETIVHEPVPVRPLTYQSSLIVTAEARHHEVALIELVAVFVEHDAAEQQPIGSFATRPERPDTLEVVAVGRAQLLCRVDR